MSGPLRAVFDPQTVVGDISQVQQVENIIKKKIKSVPFETQKSNIEKNKNIPKEMKEGMIKSLERIHKS